VAAVQVRYNLAYEFNSLSGKIGCLDRQTSDVAARLRQIFDKTPPPRGFSDGTKTILIHNYKIAITSKYRISNQPAFPVAREAQ
jgi:hypothetical protein